MVRVLVADDELNARSTFKEYLESEGYSVSLARNGKEALKKFEKKSYPVAIIDCRMTPMDGFETANEILKKNKNTSIIFVSAWMDMYQKKYAKLAPIASIKKPLLFKEQLIEPTNKGMLQYLNKSKEDLIKPILSRHIYRDDMKVFIQELKILNKILSDKSLDLMMYESGQIREITYLNMLLSLLIFIKENKIEDKLIPSLFTEYGISTAVVESLQEIKIEKLESSYRDELLRLIDIKKEGEGRHGKK